MRGAATTSAPAVHSSSQSHWYMRSGPRWRVSVPAQPAGEIKRAIGHYQSISSIAASLKLDDQEIAMLFEESDPRCRAERALDFAPQWRLLPIELAGVH